MHPCWLLFFHRLIPQIYLHLPCHLRQGFLSGHHHNEPLISKVSPCWLNVWRVPRSTTAVTCCRESLLSTCQTVYFGFMVSMLLKSQHRESSRQSTQLTCRITSLPVPVKAFVGCVSLVCPCIAIVISETMMAVIVLIVYSNLFA